jgi:hypothetical protein
MKVFVVAVTCLLFVAASASATTVFTDDFENYTAYTANNGNGIFVAPGTTGAPGEPNIGNWQRLHTWGGERDAGQVVAAGGPHQANTPSGYGDSQGMSNFDGGAPHGSSMALPGGVAPAGSTVSMSAHVNIANGGHGYFHIGDETLSNPAPAGTPDYYAGAIMMPNGNLSATTNGPEPKGPVDWSVGWIQVKLEAVVGADGNVEVANAYSRPAEGGAWTLAAANGAAGAFTASHFAFSVPQYGTFDNLVVDVTAPIPEPATLSMLVMSLLGLALAGRRRKNG